MDLPPGTDPALVIPVVLLIGALAGTTAYVAAMSRRQRRQISEIVERLAIANDPIDLAETQRIRDGQLRDGLGRLARRIAETWTLATMDLLTEIPNRQALLTRLHGEIDRATRYQRQLAVILIDIDHFKRLNDTHGHAAGDLVLHHVAQALQANLRSVDHIGRYGGEEFMVVLPETDVDTAASIAEKLRRLVGRHDVELEGGDVVHVTMSAGVAGGIGGNLRLDTLIRDADAALYSAKALGRDQVYVFHEIEDDKLIRRAAIAPSAREHAVNVGRAASHAATQSLRDVLEARATWAGKPSNLIAETAMALARSLDLPQSEIERIRTASLLHDLGKLAIPDEILAKPGDLDEPEWRVIAEHPKIGQVVLEQAGALRDAATIVLHHHEWYDGRGYPHGLRGREIPIGSRIVAVADAYEAMIAGRPYREAIDHSDALAELRRQAGIQFDPEIVALFASMFGDGVPWSAAAWTHDHDREHSHSDPASEPSYAPIPDSAHVHGHAVAVAADAVPAGDAVAGADVKTGDLGMTGTDG